MLMIIYLAASRQARGSARDFIARPFNAPLTFWFFMNVSKNFRFLWDCSGSYNEKLYTFLEAWLTNLTHDYPTCRYTGDDFLMRTSGVTNGKDKDGIPKVRRKPGRVYVIRSIFCLPTLICTMNSGQPRVLNAEDWSFDAIRTYVSLVISL